MPVFANDISTLDFQRRGIPYFDASSAGAINLASLDFANRGEPFYGSEVGSTGPDTVMSAEFSVYVTFTAPLQTSLKFAADFDVDFSITSTGMNLGSSAKMEMIF